VTLATAASPLRISDLPLLASCGGLLAQPSAPPVQPSDPRAAQVGAMKLANMLRGKK
jgi:hypothetical protein